MYYEEYFGQLELTGTKLGIAYAVRRVSCWVDFRLESFEGLIASEHFPLISSVRLPDRFCPVNPVTTDLYANNHRKWGVCHVNTNGIIGFYAGNVNSHGPFAVNAFTSFWVGREIRGCG
jgi:hypothetical protein